MMKVDHPDAFRFLFRDELYLLPGDKAAMASKPVSVPTLPDEETVAPVTEAELSVTKLVAEEPVTTIPEPPATQQPLPITTPAGTFNYLGKNNKQFLILVNYSNEEFIAANHLAALQSILKRKELEMDDIAIVNMHAYAAATMRELYKFFKPTKLLVLGQKAIPEGLGAVTLNQLRQEKVINILYSYSFDDMMDSNELKKAFWDQMKTL